MHNYEFSSQILLFQKKSRISKGFLSIFFSHDEKHLFLLLFFYILIAVCTIVRDPLKQAKPVCRIYIQRILCVHNRQWAFVSHIKDGEKFSNTCSVCIYLLPWTYYLSHHHKYRQERKSDDDGEKKKFVLMSHSSINLESLRKFSSSCFYGV